jgi:hypothetical protein
MCHEYLGGWPPQIIPNSPDFMMVTWKYELGSHATTQIIPGCTREAPGKTRWVSAAHCPPPHGRGDMPMIFECLTQLASFILCPWLARIRLMPFSSHREKRCLSLCFTSLSTSALRTSWLGNPLERGE